MGVRPGRVTQHHVEIPPTHGVPSACGSRIRVYQSYLDWQEAAALHENRPATVRGLGDGPRWREFRLTPAADATVVDVAEERWTPTAIMVFARASSGAGAHWMALCVPG